MLLKRFYDTKLAQASYMIGCAATGEAVVIDANRDTDAYIRAAAAEGLTITKVTETHIHADFVSGSRELASRTGAKLLLSDEGGSDWKYAFAADAGATLLHDGDTFRVGNVSLQVLHTPGHTPEHLSFLVTDTVSTDRPIGVITGDFIFVGDVGRPDLLERAAHMYGTMEVGARTLFRSLQRFKELPDYLQIWPGHGAGSACGKSLGSLPSSTLGYERIANWGLGIDDEDEFVRMVLAGQPEPPRYFAEMKRINKEGPRILGGQRRPELEPNERLASLLASGALVIDTRPAAEFGARHVPGTINVPLNASFTTWAGWLVPYDRDFYLIVNDACTHCIDEATHDLAMIGLDRVAGYFGANVVDAWSDAGRDVGTVSQISTTELAGRLAGAGITVIDVRGQAEWESGHIPGAENIPLGYLDDRFDDVPRDTPVVVQCQTGPRSSIAASLLRAKGFTNVSNLAGGFAEWRAHGNQVEREAPANAAV